MKCPIKGFTFTTTVFVYFEPHFKSGHNISKPSDIEILLDAVQKLKCKFNQHGCNQDFRSTQQLQIHEKVCTFSPSAIRCERVKYGCKQCFEDEDKMKRHMTNECLYKQETIVQKYPCGNASKGCTKMYKLPNHRDDHMKDSCDFQANKSPPENAVSNRTVARRCSRAKKYG